MSYVAAFAGFFAIFCLLKSLDTQPKGDFMNMRAKVLRKLAGTARWIDKDLQEAERLYKEETLAFGPCTYLNRVDVASSLHNTAQVLEEQHFYAEALHLRRRTVHILGMPAVA
jgi:hypothetical protein